MVEEMDKGIGEIVSALAKHDLKHQTLVMFCSDNGATARGSNGPLRGNKGQLWEGGHRVPCIASWPGKIPPGSVSKELAITLDVMPTILAAAGIEPPSKEQFDGRNLLPHLTEGKPLGERTLFWGHGNSRAMRKGDWKLILNAPGQKQPGLFDLSRDLSEQKNLAKDHPERIERMESEISLWEAEMASTATPQSEPAPQNEK